MSILHKISGDIKLYAFGVSLLFVVFNCCHVMKEKSVKKEESFNLEDIELEEINLNVPSPPDSLPYEHFIDFYFENLLVVNQLAGEDLTTLLAEDRDIYIRAAAAHVIGCKGDKTALNELRRYLSLKDDFVGVEIAYAMYRLGDINSEKNLLKLLKNPLDTYFSPVLAAGYLAQIGNPSGYYILRKVFDNPEYSSLKIMACKQFYYFLPYSDNIEVFHLYEKALNDPNLDLQWQALVQLRNVQLSTDMRNLLTKYVRISTNDSFIELAKILACCLVKISNL